MTCRDCGKICGASICVDCFLIQVQATPSDPSRIKENRYSGVGIEYGVLSALFEMYPQSNVGLVAINAQTAFDEAKKFLDNLVHNQCELAGCHSNGKETVHTELCVLHLKRHE
jgi:hypothetical protein